MKVGYVVDEAKAKLYKVHKKLKVNLRLPTVIEV